MERRDSTTDETETEGHAREEPGSRPEPTCSGCAYLHAAASCPELGGESGS